jgi:hypothetical protein
MHIRITDAGRTIRHVVIEDERAVVGAVAEVSDEFVRRLKAEMPHVQFEENVQPDSPPVTDTSQDDAKGDSDAGDTKAKDTTA